MANLYHGRFGFWGIISRCILMQCRIIALLLLPLLMGARLGFADSLSLQFVNDRVAVTDRSCADRLRENSAGQPTERGHALFYLRDKEIGAAARSYIQQMRALLGPTVLQFQGCYIYPVMMDDRQRSSAMTGRFKITFKPEHIAKLRQDGRVKVLLEDKKIGYLGPFYKMNLAKVQDDLRREYSDAVIESMPFNELYLRMQTL